MALIISGTTATGVTLVAGNSPVTITTAAYLTNNTSGTNAVYGNTGAPITIFNAGQVAGKYDGVKAVNLTTLTNKVTGLILGGSYGVYVNSKAGTVTNLGNITGNIGTGIYLNAAGISFGHAVVVNQASGTIGGGSDGIILTQATVGSSTVTNAGAISGTNNYGVYLKAGGLITNLSGGHIGGGVNGVLVKQGGTIVNQSSAVISGGRIGVDIFSNGAGNVANAGTISGGALGGVYLADGGSVVNSSGGAIGGGQTGILIQGTVLGAGTVTNAGAISGTNSYGVYLMKGGTVTNLSGGQIGGGARGIFVAQGGGTIVNQSSATISGGTDGVRVTLGPETVTNAGTISGSGGYGLYLGGGGSVVNSSSGTIAGGRTGIFASGAAATITNSGTIAGTSAYGIKLTAGGIVTNTSTGSISAGGIAAIAMSGASGTSQTVVNAGTLSGADAVAFSAGATNRLILDPSGVISGAINGGNTIGATATSTLELAAGATQGQIFGFGSVVANNVTNFSQIVVDAAAQWELSGPNTLAAGTTLTNSGLLSIFNGGLGDAGSVVNNGQIQDSGTLTVGTLTGAGQVLIGANSAMTTTGTVAASETISFTGGGGLLDLAPTGFSGVIQGFESGDAIELAGISNATSAGIVNGNTLAVTLSSGGPIDLVLAPDQIYSNLIFAVKAPGGSFGTNDFISVAAASGPTIVDQGSSLSVTGAQAATLAAVGSGLGGVTVTDPNSLLTTTTNVFTVGDGSLGSLSIQAGGTVVTTPGTGTVGAIITAQSGASGSEVAVAGTNSNWQVGGTLQVGAAGEGTLAVVSQGSVAAAGIVAGISSSATGVISLSGAGSNIADVGQLTVGSAGVGEVSISNGAVATAANADLGLLAGASGNVDIEGAGSHLSITNNMNIGDAGLGVLTVGQGSTLTVVNNLNQGANGLLNVVGGTVDPASGTLAGTTTVSAGGTYEYGTLTIKSTGTITVQSGIGNIDLGTITGSGGVLNIGANGDFVLGDSTGGATGPVITSTIAPVITFADNTGTLTVEDAAVLGTLEITAFTAGDVVDLPNLVFASTTIVNTGTIELLNGIGGVVGDVLYNAATVNGATLAAAIACFATGSRIATARGEVAVEALLVGDRVLTAFDGAAEVIWLGHRHADCRSHPRPHDVWPVRVMAGAFGEGRPRRDLSLSPDHAVFVDGMLIPVRQLINGASVVQDEVDAVTYWHVELQQHDVLLAEGLPCESYLDTDDHDRFANGHTAPERLTLMEPCAPFRTQGEEVERVRRQLRERTTELVG